MMLLKVLNKTKILALLLLALLLMSSGSRVAAAQTKLYQYDGKLPFVQMMLNMMVAMGVLDKLPTHGAFGAYGPYGNPASPWSRSPWGHSTADGASPVWGTPDWGVLPMHSYSYNSYAPYGSRWPTSDLRGWVNEPWELSEWNSSSENEVKSQSKVGSKTQSKATNPVIHERRNFNNDMPKGRQRSGGLNSRSPLAKLRQPQRQRLKKQSDPPRREMPCVTEFCGLKKPNLNGLWVTRDGEMLGVRNHRYLWSDGKSRYLTGQIKVQNEYLLTNIDGYEKLMRYKYKLADNHLLTLQPDGKIREFIRLSNDYRGQFTRRYPAYGQNYGSYNRPFYGREFGHFYR